MIFALHALLAHAIPLLVGVAVVTVALLTLPFLVSWFTQRAAMMRENRHNVAVTFAEGLNDGKYSVIQGIFDQRQEQFAAARRVIADRLADPVKRLHEPNPLTVWQ